VSVVAVRRVLEHSYATGTDRLVLVVLAEHADKETWTCFPSVAIIAKEANVKERAAQAALRALQEAGEIDVEIHGAPYPKTRQQYRPNLYRVTVGPCASGAPGDTTSADPVVHDSAPSGARERCPVVHGGGHPNRHYNRQGIVIVATKAKRLCLCAPIASKMTTTSSRKFSASKPLGACASNGRPGGRGPRQHT
jgi:hypothetical protein